MSDGGPARRPTSRPARLASLVLIGWLAASLLPASPARAAGISVPLQDPRTGEPVQLEHGARVLHVVFFATWCPDCVAELEGLAELEARWGDDGYRLVLVAVNTRHDRERLARFAGQRHPPGRLLFDVDGACAKALKALDVPTHLLFDASGVELLRLSAFDAQVEQELQRRLGRRRGGAP